MKWLLPLYCSVLLLPNVYGQESAPATLPSHSSNLSEVFLALLLIVGGIFFLAWCVKKVGYQPMASSSHMKIKACLPLSTKEKLMLIEVGQEQILIGVAPGYVGNIKSLETPIDFTASDKKLGFSAMMEQMLNKNNAQNNTTPTNIDE